MSRLGLLLSRLRASFWFLPALVVLASMIAATLLVELDDVRGSGLAEWSPRLFGASAEGSRAMLSAIATSMVTVAGVVFSITVVVLSQTSNQYSPRVLRTFMRDRPTQWVLGVFVGIFAYCLVVLRTVRGPEEGAFIPSIAVLGGMAYAFAGMAMLIYFIHHVAQSIQASSIVERIAEDTRAAIDHLFPQQLGEAPAEDGVRPVPSEWTPIAARKTGYVVSVDGDRLMRVAIDRDRIVRLAVSVGDFVVEGGLLLEIAGAASVDRTDADHLRHAVLVDRQRTHEQDAAFGLQQLVDVALKALSPGINDPSTACLCIDRLGALLGRLAGRRMPAAQRLEGGRLRVIAPAPEFARMLSLAFDQIVAHSRGDVQVLWRTVEALRTVASMAPPSRRTALAAMARALERALHDVKPRRRAAEPLRMLVALRGACAGDADGYRP